MTSGHSHSTRRSGFSSHGHGSSVVSVTSHHRMPISMTVLPKHRQGPGHNLNLNNSSSSGSSHQGLPQGPAATAKHLAAASAARALARQQQQARAGTGARATGAGHKATMSVFGSFLKFANFDDFFSSLQDNDNSDHNHHNQVDTDGPVSVCNSDGVYLLSGTELPEQDLLEDTDYDLRYISDQP